MKALRIATILLIVVSLFVITANAVEFTPSVEFKDAPEIVNPADPDDPKANEDELEITPVGRLGDEDIDEDIKENLTDAKNDLEGNDDWEDILDNFEDIWNEATDGAPIEHAIVSDIIDVRYKEDPDHDGTVTIVFDMKLQGLDSDDLFVIIAKPEGGVWAAVDYTISEDGIVTITVGNKSVFAIIRDKSAMPDIGPDGPATGVSPYFAPAIAGMVFFGAAAAVCVSKVVKRTER